MEIKTIHDFKPGYRFGRWTVIKVIHRPPNYYVHARCDCGTERKNFMFCNLNPRPYSCIHCSPRYGIPKTKLRNGCRYNGWKVISNNPKYTSVYEVECKNGHVLKAVVLGKLIGDEKLICKQCVPIYQRGGRKKYTTHKVRNN